MTNYYVPKNRMLNNETIQQCVKKKEISILVQHDMPPQVYNETQN